MILICSLGFIMKRLPGLSTFSPVHAARATGANALSLAFENVLNCSNQYKILVTCSFALALMSKPLAAHNLCYIIDSDTAIYFSFLVINIYLSSTATLAFTIQLNASADLL